MWAWSLLALLPLALSHPTTAQDASASIDDDEIFFERVEVNLVNVDVFVTDKQGNRVTDLTTDDFEVFEDGRPVDVTNFYAVKDRVVRRSATKPLVPAVEPKANPKGPAPPRATVELPSGIPDSQKLSVVVFIDNLNLRPFNRNTVMREIKEFLRTHLVPEDEVMVVSYQRTVKIMQPFTNDQTKIRQALLHMEKDAGLGAPGQTERRDVIRSIEMARDQSDAMTHVELYAEKVFHDMSTSMRVMKDLVGSLGGLPGRKALIHVSDGVPMTAADDLFQLIDRIWQDEAFSGKLISNRYSGRRLMQELNARANASRVTFYTIDATGLRSHNSLSAEYGGSTGNLSQLASLAEIDFARFSNETETLQTMALETGGQAVFNTNNFDDAFDRVGRDFSTYYSLGYLSRFHSDGRYHSIDVKVRRKGLKVRHRDGFRTRTVEATVNDSTYASLLYDRESNDLDVEIEFERPEPRDNKKYLTPILVKIPISRIVLIPRENLHQGRLRVSVAVIDRQGRLSPVDQQRVAVEIPLADLETARGKYYVYTANLLMRAGEQQVAVGVRDDYSGESSFVKAGIDIGI